MAKVTRSREVRVNMGNYEHMITSASVEIEYGDEPVDVIAAETNRILDKLLRADVQDAHLHTSEDAENTFVHDYWTVTEKRGKGK